MSTLLIAPAVALAIASAAGPALATDDYRIAAPKSDWMSVAEVADKVAAQGYRIREIEVDHGVYEVSAYDGDGRRIKLHLHPVTGEVLRHRTRDRSGRR